VSVKSGASWSQPHFQVSNIFISQFSTLVGFILLSSNHHIKSNQISKSGKAEIIIFQIIKTVIIAIKLVRIHKNFLLFIFLCGVLELIFFRLLILFDFLDLIFFVLNIIFFLYYI
jgi:hypothetical protein